MTCSRGNLTQYPTARRIEGLHRRATALHGVIENGNDAESKCGVYAALATGAVSV